MEILQELLGITSSRKIISMLEFVRTLIRNMGKWQYFSLTERKTLDQCMIDPALQALWKRTWRKLKSKWYLNHSIMGLLFKHWWKHGGKYMPYMTLKALAVWECQARIWDSWVKVLKGSLQVNLHCYLLQNTLSSEKQRMKLTVLVNTPFTCVLHLKDLPI